MNNSSKSSKKQTRKLLAEILASVTDEQFYHIINQSKTKCKSHKQSAKSQKP